MKGTIHLQTFLGGEYLSESLASLDTKGVAQQVDLLYIFHGLECVDVAVDVTCGVQLQAFPFEGENLVGGGHCLFCKSARRK